MSDLNPYKKMGKLTWKIRLFSFNAENLIYFDLTLCTYALLCFSTHCVNLGHTRMTKLFCFFQNVSFIQSFHFIALILRTKESSDVSVDAYEQAYVTVCFIFWKPVKIPLWIHNLLPYHIISTGLDKQWTAVTYPHFSWVSECRFGHHRVACGCKWCPWWPDCNAQTFFYSNHIFSRPTISCDWLFRARISAQNQQILKRASGAPIFNSRVRE